MARSTTRCRGSRAKCKVTRQAVKAWENGSTQALEGSNLVLAARALLTTEDWILSGRDPRCDAQGNMKSRGSSLVSYPDDIRAFLDAFQSLSPVLQRLLEELILRLAALRPDQKDRRRAQ